MRTKSSALPLSALLLSTLLSLPARPVMAAPQGEPPQVPPCCNDSMPPQGPPLVGTPPPPAGTPTLAQLGATSAQVPMKHGSAGLDAGTHVLAHSGNLGMKAKLSLNCPAGHAIQYLSYRPPGQAAVVVVDGKTTESALSRDIDLQPFSSKEVETACQKALGGSWSLPSGNHHNPAPTAPTLLEESITVRGRCAGAAGDTVKTYPFTLSLTCVDQGFVVPAAP